MRLRAETSSDGVLFVGIAATADVDAYLDGVGHDEIVEWDADQADITDVEYVTHRGTAIPDAPGSEMFWETSAAGTGEQILECTIEPGDWTVVVMNTDASSGIGAEVSFGTRVPASVQVIAWTVFALGVVALVSGATLLITRLGRVRRLTAS